MDMNTASGAVTESDSNYVQSKVLLFNQSNHCKLLKIKVLVLKFVLDFFTTKPFNSSFLSAHEYIILRCLKLKL